MPFIKLSLQVGNKLWLATFMVSRWVTKPRNPREAVPVLHPRSLRRGPLVTTFPHRLSGGPSLPSRLLPLLHCPLVSRPGAFLCSPPPFSLNEGEGGTIGQFPDTELGQPASLLEDVLASWCVLFGSTSKLRKVTDDGLNLFSMQIVEWYK